MKKPNPTVRVSSVTAPALPAGAQKEPAPATPPAHDVPAGEESTTALAPAGQGVFITLPTGTAPVQEPTQRLSLDIPESLHHAIKMSCLQRRVSMKDSVMALLRQVYMPEQK